MTDLYLVTLTVNGDVGFDTNNPLDGVQGIWTNLESAIKHGVMQATKEVTADLQYQDRSGELICSLSEFASRPDLWLEDEDADGEWMFAFVNRLDGVAIWISKRTIAPAL